MISPTLQCANCGKVKLRMKAVTDDDSGEFVGRICENCDNDSVQNKRVAMRRKIESKKEKANDR